jgi:hypothetical protein
MNNCDGVFIAVGFNRRLYSTQRQGFSQTPSTDHPRQFDLPLTFLAHHFCKIKYNKLVHCFLNVLFVL